MRVPACAAAVLFVSLALPQAATAQSFDPVTDSDFAIDLYTGPVLGSTRIIGMGGAAVATAEGASGLPFNPAAPAVRPANSHGKWDWDWNIDWLNPEIGNDFDNNGIETDERTVGTTAIGLGGVTLNYRRWAFGLTVGGQSFDVARDVMGSEQTYRSTFWTMRLGASRTFWNDEIAAGLSVLLGTYTLAQIDPDERQLIALQGGALELGAVWLPRDRNIRVGFTAAGRAETTNTIPADCPEPMPGAPIDCDGIIIPERVEVPWKLAAGVAWRRAPSRWHKKIDKRWRDERALLLAADVVVSGDVDNGYGMEQYVLAGELQPSGRKVVVSYRGGADYEWVPGRFRVRGGAYWEPARFLDADGNSVAGRLHITLGFDVRIWSFDLWDKPYRLRLSLTGDGAERYGNAALSIGFWH